MSHDLKNEYIIVLRKRYENASKKDKGKIIEEAKSNLGYHRKAIIRLLNRKTNPTKRGRRTSYSDEEINLLKEVWKFMGYVCSKKVKGGLITWLRFIQAPEGVKTKLIQMSPATIDRRLKPFRAQRGRQLRSGTKPGYLIKRNIPIKPFENRAKSPGSVELDTVAHCGESLTGKFVWTLTLTDVYSNWTENRTINGKYSRLVVEALREIEDLIPFHIKTVNVDNGSEFLNHYFIKYIETYHPSRPTRILSRSRVYRKNDNCHVEQKNFTHVRELFGYERFQGEELIPIMNKIYDIHNTLQNFFIPQMKLEHKERRGSKYYRKYTQAKTPYQWIMESEVHGMEFKAKLKEKMGTLNPILLRKKLIHELKEFNEVWKKVYDKELKVA